MRSSISATQQKSRWSFILTCLAAMAWMSDALDPEAPILTRDYADGKTRACGSHAEFKI
jgi:hypothetical protein